MKNAVSKKIVICIDAWEAGSLAGRIYHPILGPGSRFWDVNQLFSRLEGLFNTMRYPAASTRQRVFGRPRMEAGKENEVKQPMEWDEGKAGAAPAEQPTGHKATFVVQVMYRQNATWQGKVVWLEKNEAKNFRSALELIKLIDSAAEESGL